MNDRLPRGREAERVLATEMLQELRALRTRMTEFAGLLQGNLVNNTLAVETIIFPADGYVMRSWHAACGAVRVANLSDSNEVTVTSGFPGSAPPTSGVGVHIVLPHSTATIAIAGRQLTLFGTAEQRVSYQAFTGAIRPSSG